MQMHWSFVTLHGDCLVLMRKFACLLVNPITQDNFAAIFNSKPVDRASDSLMARTKHYSYQLIGTGTLSSVVGLPDDLLLLYISCLADQGSPSFTLYLLSHRSIET